MAEASKTNFQRAASTHTLTYGSNYVFYPVACGVVVGFTAFTGLMLAKMLELQPPSQQFEFLPEGHMMLNRHKVAGDLFASNGGADQYVNLNIIWGLDAAKPISNLEDYTKWAQWTVEPKANLIWDFVSKKVDDKLAVQHLLKVGEQLSQHVCPAGNKACSGAHPSGKFFVPGTMRCPIRNTMLQGATGATLQPQFALADGWKNTVLPANVRQFWGVQPIDPNNTLQVQWANLSSVGSGPLALKYFQETTNINDLITGNPLTTAGHKLNQYRHPYFPNDPSIFESSGIFVAETMYRTTDHTWNFFARYASPLRDGQQKDSDPGVPAQVTYVQPGDADHPGRKLDAQ